MLALRVEPDEQIVIRDMNTKDVIITISNDLRFKKTKVPNRHKPILGFSASNRFNISREKINGTDSLS